MIERPRVLLALSPSAEQAVERLLFAEQAPLTLVASALEAPELERLADEQQPDAVFLSPDLPGLSAACCARLRAGGRLLVGLFLDEPSASALAAFGVDAVVGPEIDGAGLRAALTGGTGGRQPPGASPTEARSDTDRLARRYGDAEGTILAVVGSRGAPGASECAASLAALASERWPTALVECDLLGGGLDLRLAADGHDGSLLGLVRACAAG